LYDADVSRQVDHLTGGNCSLTPPQLVFETAKEFEELRSLCSADGSWMTIYFRQTKLSGDYLTSLSAIGDALLRRARKLNVKDSERWVQIQKGSLELLRDVQSKANQ